MRKADILRELKSLAPEIARGKRQRTKQFLADLLEMERAKTNRNESE